MKKPIIAIDFETRSVCDLRKTGAHLYANHPTTDILCMAYSINGERPVSLWILGEPMPIDIMLEIDAGASVVAHNAAFEYLIWNGVGVKKYGWPPLKLEQLYCTMTMCYSLGLPGSLDNASKSLGINHKKDLKGHRIMLQLCKPRSGPDENCKWCSGRGWYLVAAMKPYKMCEYCVQWWTKQEPAKPNVLSGQQKYDWLYRYCQQDVVVEEDVLRRVLPLSPLERQTWILDQKINERGIEVDADSVKAAIELIEIEAENLDDQMKKVTKNSVASCRAVAQMKRWIEEEYNIKVESLAKADILDLLDKDDLPEAVRVLLTLRQQGSKSSNAKLQKMLNMIGTDKRLRGQFQYHGAASTGRWAGRGVQLQNLTRPKISHDSIEAVISLLEKI